MRHYFKNPTLRFTMPVIAENIVSTSIGMVISSIIGGISVSALACVGLVNTFYNVITAAATFLTTGSAVLVARIAGENDVPQTSRAVEQTFFLSAVFGLLVMAICEIFASPILHLLMRSAEASAFREGMIYYRTMIAAFPLLLIGSTMGGSVRAVGNAAPVMLGTILTVLAQLLSSWILIAKVHTEVFGAGLAYGISRLVFVAWMLFVFLNEHRKFRFRFKGVFQPDKALLRRIAHLGVPTMLESVSVQLAYLIANAMAMGLGTHEVSVYQVASTLNGFSSLPQSITSVVVITLVGQALGAKDYDRAKRVQQKTLRIAMICSLVISIGIAIFAFPLAGLYTTDASIQTEGARLMWLMIGFAIFGTILNSNDPVLRTAGDVSYVMRYTIFCVWVIRLPLTYLLAYAFNLGAFGVHLANILSLIVRCVFDLRRIHKGKWLYLKV